MKLSLNHLSLPLAAVTLLVITGCSRDEVKVYKADAGDVAPTVLVPPTATGAMPASMPSGLPTPDNSGLPPLKYTLPGGWTEKELSQMRVASFAVSENDQKADVSVIPMDGMAGGNLANVIRWRGQVGLPPISAAEVETLAEKITIGGQPADLFDVAGTAPGSGDAQRILAAVLHREDTAWFFKMTGESALVEKQKPAFISFLKSVEFGGPAAPTPMDISQLPPSQPAISGLAPAAPVGDKPTWTVPTGWTEGPLAQFLIAKFLIVGQNGAQASVNVSSLDGDGGGLAANVNRWRAQLGLAPIVEILSTEIEANGAKGTVVEFSGTDGRTGKPAALVGVMVPQHGSTWFYKLMGDATIVAEQKTALIKFIQSAKYPDAH